MNPLTQLIIAQIPAIFTMIREARAKDDPTAPPVTTEEVLATFELVFSSSLERDQILRAALRAELGLPPEL